MGFSFNQVHLVGTIGRDRETRIVNDNMAITNVNIATEHSYKKKGDKEYTRETTWHKLVFFNLSDFFTQQLNKGMTIHVTGRLSVNEWTDKEGKKRYSSEIICDNNSLIVFEKGERPQSKTKAKVNVPDDDNDELPF